MPIYHHAFGLNGGRNRCIDPHHETLEDPEAIHRLHIAPGELNPGGPTHWKVARLAEPDSPFDGLWYVTEQSLIFEHQTFINRLLTAAATRKHNSEQQRQDLARFVNMTREHETAHWTLVAKWSGIPGMDPADDFEVRVARDSEDLDRTLREDLKRGEARLQRASDHPHVRAIVCGNPDYLRPTEFWFPVLEDPQDPPTKEEEPGWRVNRSANPCIEHTSGDD